MYPRELEKLLAAAARRDERRHVNGLLVMHEHVRQEHALLVGVERRRGSGARLRLRRVDRLVPLLSKDRTARQAEEEQRNENPHRHRPPWDGGGGLVWFDE